jgi:hypothetical protein
MTSTADFDTDADIRAVTAAMERGILPPPALR